MAPQWCRASALSTAPVYSVRQAEMCNFVSCHTCKLTAVSGASSATVSFSVDNLL